MAYTHAISFSADIEDRFGPCGKGFGLSILASHFSKYNIEADRPLDKAFAEAAKQSNSGLLLKARLLPGDIMHLRQKGFDIEFVETPPAPGL